LQADYYPLDRERDTGRVLLRRDGQRIELDFAALRGPDLPADLRARDFTINALAVEPDGELVDLVGGQADLQAGLIRAVSADALDADPLRMLRSVRLAAELGLRLETATAAWMAERAGALARVSAERVRDELVRTLAAPSAAAHLGLLDELGLLPVIFPELGPLKEQAQTFPHRFDVWRHTLMVVDTVEGVEQTLVGRRPLQTGADAPAGAWDDVAEALAPFASALTAHLAADCGVEGRDRRTFLRLAALCHDLGKPLTCTEDDERRLHFYNHEQVGAQMAEERMRQLCFSRAEAARVGGIVAAHMRPCHLAEPFQSPARRAIYRFFRAVGDAGIEVALLALADHLAVWGPNLQPERWAWRVEGARTLLSHYFQRREETIAPPRLVGGDELLAELGLTGGPQVGRLLEGIREAQAAGEVRTREEALALARRLVGG